MLTRRHVRILTRMAGSTALIIAVGLSCFAAENTLPNWLDIPENAGIQVQVIPGAQSNVVNASAAIVMEAATGHILFEQDIDERLPMASTTKIMSALITLEQPDLDAMFTVDSQAIKTEGSSMGLQQGDVASLRALAVGMLLSSGNDAANAAAVRISGSVPAFVAAMNQRAAALGLQNTSFETPSGLDGENHYSTARDMANLAREALRNPNFSEICSQYKVRTSFGNPPYDRWLTNHNKLLNFYDGAIGVKTGFTKKSGRCLVSAAKRDGVTLICVTLNCGNDWEVHQNLLDRYFSQIQVEDISKSIPETIIPVTGGTKTSVHAVQYETRQIPVPIEGAEITYRVTSPPFLYAPIQSGQYVGEVEVLLNHQPVATLSLIAAEEIPLAHPYAEKKSLGEWLRSLFTNQK